MRNLATHHGPFGPGLFTMLALIRRVPDLNLLFTSNVLPTDVFVRVEGMPFDMNLDNFSGSSRSYVRRNFPWRPGRLPHGTAGRLWQEFGLDLCRLAAREVGSLPSTLSELCIEVDRTLIEGLDLLEPAVRKLAGLAECCPLPDSTLAEAPTFFKLRIGDRDSIVSVGGFTAELLAMERSGSGELWHGTWPKSVESFEDRAWSILRQHVSDAIRHSQVPARETETERRPSNRDWHSIA